MLTKKNIIISLFIFSSVIIFSSCNKDKEVCYKCTKVRSRAQYPTTQEFCQAESQADATVANYEADGYDCVRQ